VEIKRQMMMILLYDIMKMLRLFVLERKKEKIIYLVTQNVILRTITTKNLL
jgi:hypothetical protein